MPYTKRIYPKKIAAAAIATKAAATKMHNKFIKSARYLIKHFPDPCVITRLKNNNPYDWPKLVGLTGGRHLSAEDVRNMTMAIIVRAAASTHPEKQYSVQAFLKATKEYWPSGLMINDDWSNFLARNCTDPKCMKVATELEEFVDAYYTKVEGQLASLYLEIGHKYGQAYIEVLQRRFKRNWSTQNNTMLKADVKADIKSEEKIDTTINFNFNTRKSREIPPEVKKYISET